MAPLPIKFHELLQVRFCSSTLDPDWLIVILVVDFRGYTSTYTTDHPLSTTSDVWLEPLSHANTYCRPHPSDSTLA